MAEGDRGCWQDMRRALWPEWNPCDDPDEFAQFVAVASIPQAWIAYVPDGTAIGLAEASVRSYAEGPCGPSPYLEGVWVTPEWRRRGTASALLQAAEQWALTRGFDGIGSDALLDDEASHAWHRACGFAEIERIVVFRKLLTES